MPTFECPDCDASFNTLSSMENHNDKMHSGSGMADRSRTSQRGTGPRTG